MDQPTSPQKSGKRLSTSRAGRGSTSSRSGTMRSYTWSPRRMGRRNSTTSTTPLASRHPPKLSREIAGSDRLTLATIDIWSSTTKQATSRRRSLRRSTRSQVLSASLPTFHCSRSILSIQVSTSLTVTGDSTFQTTSVSRH